jgi:hypothetical protein
MRKTMIVVAAAVLAVGSTSLSTSASAFRLVPLGGFGFIHPGFGFVLAQPRGGFAFAHPGEGYGLGHFDSSFGGHRFGGSPYHGGYDYGGQSYYGGQAYYGDNSDDAGPYDGDSAYAREPYDGSNYADTSARGRRNRRAAAHR